ncbi:MAG TPA: hypothetical protein PKC72_09520, partial [Chitinophagaceae bacterium]|nr:hypothetical protein [Chitinophagaceae bacterium]
MKRFFTLLFLFACITSNARKFYVSTTGNDTNPGTITQPFRTWDKLSLVLIAGDTAYIRGGTYRINKSVGTGERIVWNGLNGTVTDSIYILNYPGESPIANFDDLLITAGFTAGLAVTNCSYIHVEGLRITGLAQNPSGNTVVGLNCTNVDHSTFKRIEVDHMGGYGWYFLSGSTNNYVINCDVHHVDDRYTGWGNANGFNITGGDNSTNITFEGCRAWWCSDDGWDFFGVNAVVFFKNCWAFWNGYEPGTFIQRGDGAGFKLGPAASDQSNNVLRTLENCLAFENYLAGYDQNSGQMKYTLYNNTSFGNGFYGFNFPYHQSIVHTFKNNTTYNDPTGALGNNIFTGPNTSNNSWNSPVTVTSADFISTNSAGADGPRQPDGSLPNLNFLKLATGSDLIDAGTNVGMPYNGNAPDLGAFETGGTTPPPNQSPTANAGPDQTITLPVNTVTVNGSGTDPDGTITAYLWTK